jgi:hypothetical protein
MSKVEREVDAIRDVLYEKTKDMTAAQHCEYFHALCEQASKDYGFWQHKTEDSHTHALSSTAVAALGIEVEMRSEATN